MGAGRSRGACLAPPAPSTRVGASMILEGAAMVFQGRDVAVVVLLLWASSVLCALGVLGVVRRSRGHAAVARARAWAVERLEEERRSLAPYAVVDAAAAAAILKCGARELAAKVRSGEVEAVAVIVVYSRHALLVHSQVRCLTQANFGRAVEAARRADDVLREARATGTLEALAETQPWLGVPFSVKECLDVAGLETTNGSAALVGGGVGNDDDDAAAKEDAPLVAALRALGAIPLVKTNVPQTLLSFECVNPVFGRTANPHHRGYSPGGSSGGEAALIASYGSCLGLGTDVGGSLRIPAAFSGCCSLKPTHRRLSRKGILSPTAGQRSVPAVAGPMARSAADLEFFFQTVLRVGAGAPGGGNNNKTTIMERNTNINNHPNFDDGEVIPLPFRPAERSRKKQLVFGYYTAATFVPTSPANARAVADVVAKLESRGYACKPFVAPPECDGAVDLAYGLLSADGAAAITAFIGADPVERVVGRLLTLTTRPLLRAAVVAGLRLAGQARAANLFAALGEKSVSAVWRLHVELDALRAAFHKAWAHQGIDVLVTPSMCLPAVEDDASASASFACYHTILFNLLDLPAGCLTTSIVRETDAQWGDDYDPSSMLHRRVRALYDVSKQTNLPVGVQVVGPAFAEETVLAAMRLVETIHASPKLFCDATLATKGLPRHRSHGHFA